MALTLRTLGGLSTDEIARAFVVPQRTMAQRLGEGQASLIFNEGYGGRDEPAAEAIWLGRALTELLPDDPRFAACWR